MRSILVFADHAPTMSTRLAAAVALARATQGHVSVLVDTPVQSYIAMDPLGGTHIAPQALSRALDDDDTRAQAIEAELAASGVPFAVIRSEDDPIKALALAARLADVTVLPRTPSLAGDLAVASPTPILVLPDEATAHLPPRVACIAWDGGEEAANALRGALPLLHLAEAIHVLTVQDGAEDPDGAQAAGYLAKHGLSATVHRLPAEGSADETLAAAVARMGSDLLVMGAYGHSRVREYLFGGSTRHFLEKCPGQTLLLAH